MCPNRVTKGQGDNVNGLYDIVPSVRNKALFLAFALNIACDEASEGVQPATPVATSRFVEIEPVRLQRRLDTATSYDIVAGPGGATLIFAPADRAAPALVALELDRQGKPRGKPADVLPARRRRGSVSDVSASRAGPQLFVAWVERLGWEARVMGTSLMTGVGSELVDLGPAWSAPAAARGNLALAAEGDSALVFARGSEDHCPLPESGRCFHFSFHRLGAEGASPAGLPLSVPVPCREQSAHVAVAGDRWYYGVCTTSQGRPVTTLFSIQRDPAYARAERLFEGCAPLGLVVADDRIWLVADCAGSRRAAVIHQGNDAVGSLDLGSSKLECDHGGARLVVAGRSFDLSRIVGLGVVLPESLLAEGPRADRRFTGSSRSAAAERVAWTGSTLLVAGQDEGRPLIRRYRCESSAERRDRVSPP